MQVLGPVRRAPRHRPANGAAMVTHTRRTQGTRIEEIEADDDVVRWYECRFCDAAFEQTPEARSPRLEPAPADRPERVSEVSGS